MSWKQLLAWEAYDELEPIGQQAGNWQAASICSTLMNIAAAHGGSRHRFRTKDFLLEFGDDEDKPTVTAPEPPRRVYTQTWQEQKLIGMMYAAAFNHEEERQQKKRR